MEKIKKILKNPLSSVAIPLIVLMIVATCVNRNFLSANNILDLLRNISYSFIPASMLTFMIISGNLDLSVGAALTFGGMACGYVMNIFGTGAMGTALGIIIALVLCALVGLCNGILSVKLGIPTMIATLGMQYVIQGIIYVVTGGNPYYLTGSALITIGKGTLFGVQYTIWLALIFLIVLHYVLGYTTYGRKVMAIGGNIEATRLAGVKTDRNRISVYVLVSTVAGLTGVLYAARMSTAMANVGDNKALTYIAGVIIGGNSVYGGRGTIVGTLLGVAIMETISNALVLMRVTTYWQNLCVGLIMIFAVSVDALKTNFKFGKRSKKKAVTANG